MLTPLLTIALATALLGLGLAIAFLKKHKYGETWLITNSLQPSHYIQACAQSSVYFYWGWFYPGVAAYAPFIVYQLFFAFVFHFLVSVLIGRRFEIGFSVVPLVLSINLFMWVRPEYFYLQLLMVVVGVLSKFYLVRTREGKKRHIFNPSALPMALLSLYVILTQSSFLILSREVVQSFFLVPYFYFFVFLAGSVSQWVGRVSMVPFGTIFSLVLFDVLARMFIGMPLMLTMVDRSVFIGCTLLITDPATAPKNPVAQFIFGFLYGVGILVSYAVLGYGNADKIYDKILVVPILNYFTPAIESFALKLRGVRASKIFAQRQQLFYSSLYAVFFLSVLPLVSRSVIEIPNLLSNNSRFVAERPLLVPLLEMWTKQCELEPYSHVCELSARLSEQLQH